jgi:hypothetical protein
MEMNFSLHVPPGDSHPGNQRNFTEAGSGISFVTLSQSRNFSGATLLPQGQGLPLITGCNAKIFPGRS